MSNLLKLIIKADRHALKDLRNLSSNHQNLKSFNLLKNCRQDNVINQRANYSTKLTSNKLTNNQNKLLNLNEIKFFEYKTIKTTRVNNALPPIIWLVIRPVLNVAAALGGRRVRKWWQSLPEERKQYYRNKARKNKRFIYGLFGGLFVLSSIYYATHIEETAITKRKRFVAISKEKYEELSKIQFDLQLKMFEDKLLPVTHPMSRIVERIATRLIKANLDIPEFRDKNWTTAVVDVKNVKNAMVVGDGKIFVFTGMFDICENDDSLGFVIAHEIAHSILSHGAEILSYSEFINIFVTFGLFLIWSMFPTDLSAGFAHIITNKLVDILFHLPYGRKMEIEADRVGLLLAAKACLDVREGVAFWRKMAYLEQSKMEATVGDKDFGNAIEYLSTHPAHEKRAEILESMLEESLELRNKLSCPRLPYRNPIELLKQRIAFEQSLNKKPLNYAIIKAN